MSAGGFGGGLTAGIDLVAGGHYIENRSGLADSAAGVGQFVFETDTKLLWWDADGAGGAAAVVIAELIGSKGFGGAELVVIG